MESIHLLLDAVYFNGHKLGHISEQGVSWEGNDAEYTSIHAAQIRNAAVKRVLKKGATNTIKYTLIELLPEQLVATLGGEVTPTGGWLAPTAPLEVEGELKILTGTGQTITIKRATMTGAMRGTLGGDTPLGVNLTHDFLAPEDGSAPYGIEETTPFIKVKPTTLNFIKGGEHKTFSIEASGAFRISAAPAGFSVAVTGSTVKVTATANGSTNQRTGTLTLTLNSDSRKTATVQLTQAG